MLNNNSLKNHGKIYSFITLLFSNYHLFKNISKNMEEIHKCKM